MCRGNWNGAKTKSMLFFCTHFGVQKLDMTKAEKGVHMNMPSVRADNITQKRSGVT